MSRDLRRSIPRAGTPFSTCRTSSRSGIAPVAFFAENHITEGMRTLLTQGFRRLEGKSTQGFFKRTQAMGGGKTHNLLALGLLAKHPEWRVEVMGGFYLEHGSRSVPRSRA